MTSPDPYATLGQFQKDPDATLDFAVDWTAELRAGDSITAAAWTVPAGITQPATPVASLTGAKATVWLTGGSVGETYPVVCRVTTAQGRIDERTIRITVVQR